MSDPYDLRRLAAGGRRVVYRAEAPSTQDHAFLLAEHGAPDGTVALADRQTAGRGRLGRTWASPAGRGIWFSMVLRPPPDPPPVPTLLVAATAVAVASAVEAAAGARVFLRWPNDLLLGGRKTAGILLETRDYEPRAPLLVLGVGVNTALAEEDFPEEVRGEATSLLLACGAAPDRTALLEGILAEVARWTGLLHAGGGAAVEEAFAARAAHVGEEVRLLEGNEPREGILESVSPTAGIVLRGGDGRRRIVRAEHAREIRAAEGRDVPN